MQINQRSDIITEVSLAYKGKRKSFLKLADVIEIYLLRKKRRGLSKNQIARLTDFWERNVDEDSVKIYGEDFKRLLIQFEKYRNKINKGDRRGSVGNVFLRSVISFYFDQHQDIILARSSSIVNYIENFLLLISQFQNNFYTEISLDKLATQLSGFVPSTRMRLRRAFHNVDEKGSPFNCKSFIANIDNEAFNKLSIVV